MKAIILASGIGKRLQPLTNKKPKCLVQINDKSILEYQLDSLLNYNIADVIITTGPFENQIKKIVKDQYPTMNVNFVKNPKYDSTNYIYSLWLTKKLIDDDIILIHGDLVFEKKLLKKIIGIEKNGVLVNKAVPLPKKDFKAVIKNERVIQIGVNFFGEKAFFSLPLYKFLKKDFLVWMNEIDKNIKKGNTSIYAEDAFNEISDQIELRPVYFSDEICMEIDTHDELLFARKIIRNG